MEREAKESLFDTLIYQILDSQVNTIYQTNAGRNNLNIIYQIQYIYFFLLQIPYITKQTYAALLCIMHSILYMQVYYVPMYYAQYTICANVYVNFVGILYQIQFSQILNSQDINLVFLFQGEVPGGDDEDVLYPGGDRLHQLRGLQRVLPHLRHLPM